MVARRAHNPEVAGSSPASATKLKASQLRLAFLLLRLEGALPPYPLTAFHSVRYPRGSRPTDIALRAPSRSPPGGLRAAFASLQSIPLSSFVHRIAPPSRHAPDGASALRASYSLCSTDSNPRAFLFSAGEGQLFGGGPSPPVLPLAPSGGRFYGEGTRAEM